MKLQQSKLIKTLSNMIFHCPKFQTSYQDQNTQSKKQSHPILEPIQQRLSLQTPA
jgi:hypothetical protein